MQVADLLGDVPDLVAEGIAFLAQLALLNVEGQNPVQGAGVLTAAANGGLHRVRVAAKEPYVDHRSEPSGATRWLLDRFRHLGWIS